MIIFHWRMYKTKSTIPCGLSTQQNKQLTPASAHFGWYSIVANHLTVSLHDVVKDTTSILQAKSLWAGKLFVLPTYVNMAFK